MDYRTITQQQMEYNGPFLSCPLVKHLREKEKLKGQADEQIIETITQMIPPSSDDNQRTKALISYIALGGSLASLGTICYIYFNGPPKAPDCMNDAVINQVYEYCNKFFSKYIQGRDKSNCEIDIENYNRDNEEYIIKLQQAMYSLLAFTSTLSMSDKISEVSGWVTNKFKNSRCSIMGGRTRRRKSRRHMKKRKSRRRRRTSRK